MTLLSLDSEVGLLLQAGTLGHSVSWGVGEANPSLVPIGDLEQVRPPWGAQALLSGSLSLPTPTLTG